MLQKLSTALQFVREHPEIYEAEKYRTWLDRLHTRAMSLVGRAMRDLLDNAAKRCREIIQQKSLTRGESKLLEEQPIESLPIYQKFRGLSYRMKELVAVLHSSGIDKSAGGDSQYSSPRPSSYGGSKGPEQGVLLEVKQAYTVLRVELLLPFIKEAWIASLSLARSQSSVPSSLGSGTNLASIVEESKGMNTQSVSRSAAAPALTAAQQQQYLSLSVALRHVFATLIRVAQLEHQLFESLFQQDSQKGASNGSTSTSPRAVNINGNGIGYSLQKVSSFRNNGASNDQAAAISELVEVVENVANATRDFLRPLIIKESSVDELCRVISVLSEDMQAQITVLPVPSSLIKMLLSSLEITVNDAKERLTYCAETKLRQDVQLFVPFPSHLSYPDILESYEEKKKQPNNDGQSSSQMQQQEVYLTWYPPMRQTLSLLSKLYQVVAPPVFEDFARRSIEMCVDSLRTGADGVRRRGVAIHGDLFLVRHLMILREQLVPFEIRLQSTEKQLDFTSTGQALTDFMQFSRNILRFDQSNGFLLFAQQGMPSMHELQTDAKKELDTALRKACLAFKEGTTKMFAAPLDGMLAKVAAFLGTEIPYESLVNVDRDVNDDNNSDPSPSNGGGQQKGLKRHGNMKVPTLAPELRNTLKGQSFVRPERIKECLEQVQHLLTQRLPDIKEMIKVRLPSLICV